MQYAITDAAVEFAHTFYEAIAGGQPMDTAVVEARNAINIHNQYSLEWGIPVLYMETMPKRGLDSSRKCYSVDTKSWLRARGCPRFGMISYLVWQPSLFAEGTVMRSYGRKDGHRRTLAPLPYLSLAEA